jgi:hypothetical protein
VFAAGESDCSPPKANRVSLKLNNMTSSMSSVEKYKELFLHYMSTKEIKIIKYVLKGFVRKLISVHSFSIC